MKSAIEVRAIGEAKDARGQARTWKKLAQLLATRLKRHDGKRRSFSAPCCSRMNDVDRAALALYDVAASVMPKEKRRAG